MLAWYAKVLAICVFAYVLSPIDLIPDFIPIATPLTTQAGRYKVSVSAYALNTQGKPTTLTFRCRPIRERGAHEIRICKDAPGNTTPDASRHCKSSVMTLPRATTCA